MLLSVLKRPPSLNVKDVAQHAHQYVKCLHAKAASQTSVAHVFSPIARNYSDTVVKAIPRRLYITQPSSGNQSRCSLFVQRRQDIHQHPSRGFRSSTQSKQGGLGPFAIWINQRIDTIREMFFYSPAQLVLGVCIGGFGCTAAALAYFLHIKKVLTFDQLIDHVGRITHRNGSGTEDIESSASAVDALRDMPRPPLPVVTMVAWTLASVVTAVFAYTRARLRLQFREFMRQVNFSLNTVENNVLRFRTVRECTLSEVLPDNPAASSVVVKAALKTTPKQPFLALPASEHEIIMNSVLNAISPIFARDFFMANQNMPVTHQWYRFGITFAKDTRRMRKLRVVLASEDLLEQIPNMGPVSYEQEDHHFRWEVLQSMADLYHKEKLYGNEDVAPEDDQLMVDKDCTLRLYRVEVALAVHGADTGCQPAMHQPSVSTSQ